MSRYVILISVVTTALALLGAALITQADDGESYAALARLARTEQLVLSTDTGEGFAIFGVRSRDVIAGRHAIYFQNGAAFPERWQLDPAKSFCSLSLSNPAEFAPAAYEELRLTGDLGIFDVQTDYGPASTGAPGLWVKTRMRIDRGTTNLVGQGRDGSELPLAFDSLDCESPDPLKPVTLADITGLSVFAHETLWPDRLISRPQLRYSGIVAGKASPFPAFNDAAEAVPLRLVGAPSESAANK